METKLAQARARAARQFKSDDMCQSTFQANFLIEASLWLTFSKPLEHIAHSNYEKAFSLIAFVADSCSPTIVLRL